MKISRIFAWIFGICVLLLPRIEATPPVQVDEHGTQAEPIQGRTITRCDDLPRNAILNGELVIAGDIDCGGDLKWIKINGDSVIRSPGTRDMSMTNIMWVVGAGAYATFVAPTVVMTRDEGLEALEVSLIYTYGTVDFQVYGRHGAFDDGSPEDKHGLIKIKTDGSGAVHTEKFIRYTRGSIVAAYPALRPGGIFQEGNFVPTKIEPLSPYAREWLGDIHARLIAIYAVRAREEGERSPAGTQNPVGDDDLRALSNASDDAASDAAAAAAAAAALVVAGDDPGEASAVQTVGNDDASPTSSDADSSSAGGAGAGRSASFEDHDNEGATAAAAAVVENASGKRETTTEIVEGDSASDDYADSAAAAERSGAGAGVGTAITAASTTPGDSNADAAAHHLNNPAAASSGTAAGNGMTPEVPPDRADPAAGKNAPGTAPGTSMRHRWTSRSSTGYVASPVKVDRSSPPPQTPGHEKGGNGGRFFSLPPCMMPHGGAALKAGEHLRGRLYNDDLERSSYVEVLGAAVVHTRTTGKAPLDAHGRPVGAPPGKSVVLASPDRDKMAKVFRNREDMEEEDAERVRVAAGGKPKKVAAVMGWLPFGKHGFLRTRQRRHARAHRGETRAEITDRGQLEVSLDGTRVLRTFGSPWFGLGRRDPTYELGVTDEGLEIRRGGEVVREVKANFV